MYAYTLHCNILYKIHTHTYACIYHIYIDDKTKDGYEIQMMTNHFSHFLLTQQLYPLLENAAKTTGEARIINHSSEARNYDKSVDLKPESLMKNTKLGDNNMGRISRYQQSKLANCVFTYALKQRLDAKQSKVKALVCHPGLRYIYYMYVICYISFIYITIVYSHTVCIHTCILDICIYIIRYTIPSMLLYINIRIYNKHPLPLSIALVLLQCI